MARQTTHSHRRNLPPLLSEPKTSMDPTLLKKHPKSKPIFSSTTSTTKPHPTPPDPTLPSSTTLHNISHHFAKLYAGHKVLASLKGSTAHSHSPPQIDTHLQAKGLSGSTVLDTSCIALTKSNSQRGRRVAADVEKVGTRTKVKEKDKKSLIKKSSHLEVDAEKALAKQKFSEVKKSVQKVWKKEEFYDGKDVKKASVLMSKSLESDELKRFNELSEIKRPSISLAMNGGRRRSFCCSQTELADFFSCTGVKVVAVDMPPFMQIHAVECGLCKKSS